MEAASRTSALADDRSGMLLARAPGDRRRTGRRPAAPNPPSAAISRLPGCGWVIQTGCLLPRARRARAYTAALDVPARQVNDEWRDQDAPAQGVLKAANGFTGILSSAAGRWDRLRAEMFGARRRCQGCSTIVVVGDLGAGWPGGCRSAPFVSGGRSRSLRKMLQTARRNLGLRQRDVRRGSSRRCCSTTTRSTQRRSCSCSTRAGPWCRAARRAVLVPEGGCSRPC
jgi:hypothetical protein